MAITKIFPIKSRLDKRLAYVLDQTKTTGSLNHGAEDEQDKLAEQIAYVLDREKTESIVFETAINCHSTETAFAEMRQTQERFGKTDGRLGYHIIQSFAPGEVSAEEAHAIGVEFAQRCVGENYEVVIGTHLNKAHFHSHIVFNAVSFRDGRKYHMDNRGYERLRELSDTICREHGLSVIENPQSKGKHYAQWQAEQAGKPTIRSQIRADIDHIISQSLDFHTFMMLLRKKGYQVKYVRVKHMAVKPPFGQKYIRLDSLGEDYTVQAIEERLQKQEHWRKPQAAATSRQPTHLCQNFDGAANKQYYKAPAYLHNRKNRRKIKGFAALYLRYVYLLRNQQKGKVNKKTSRYLLEDALHFDRLVKQSHFLMVNQIETTDDLNHLQAKLENEIEILTNHRQPLYKAKKQAASEVKKEDIAQQIAADTLALREYRKQLRLCQTIQKEVEKKAVHIQEALQTEKSAHQSAKKALPNKEPLPKDSPQEPTLFN